MNEESNSRGPVVLLVGAIGMLLVIGGLYAVNHFMPAPAKPVEQALRMGAAEQAYVPKLQFSEEKVGRAANFLNQDVTFVFGTVMNGGSRPVKQIELGLEFHDVFGQVVLRDKQVLFSPTAPALAPGDQRDFQLGYETVPAEWNQAYPGIHVSGLLLQ
jgi:hypothetical protein